MAPKEISSNANKINVLASKTGAKEITNLPLVPESEGK